MSLDEELNRARLAGAFFYSTEGHPCTRYAIRVKDNSNYPEIIGPGDEYKGDIVAFGLACELEPEHGDFVHIEVRTKTRCRRTIRAYMMGPGGELTLKARKKGRRDYSYFSAQDKTQIDILGVMVELQRSGRRSGCLPKPAPRSRATSGSADTSLPLAA
jgi:hypothetical protein